ncbi:MAG: general secretion pathway protein GspK [Candidatus Omnitrophica bacterium]|nr:general secretion pathway protein GspK [Candidatus Omnitrophota bacterium]
MSRRNHSKYIFINQTGSILIVSVWMLALLFLLTIGLGRRVNQELIYVKYSLQKMQARYLAWAGFHYALEQIREDMQDDTSKLFDNNFACGVHLTEGQSAEDIFKSTALSTGSFEIARQKIDGENVETHFGFSDEDGKVNLNALNLQNYGILKELFVTVGVAEAEALRLAVAVVDWQDEDTVPVLKQSQSEEGPFGWNQKKIPAKNRPFDHRFELMFIDGMTPEIYQKVENLITVFPRRSQGLKINLATASQEVIRALTRNFSGPLTNTSAVDAESLAAKILVSRMGADQVEGTQDDPVLNEQELGLTAPEANIFRAMGPVRTLTSRFLVAHVTGLDATGQRRSHIDAVIDRDSLTVVSWKAD